MPSRSTSSTDFGRPSPAAGSEPPLRTEGEAPSAAWRADGASTDAWTLRAATVTGVRHRLAAQESDDTYAWAHDGSSLVVAVADGVGSVAGARTAATRACRAAVSEGLAAVAAGAEGAVRAGIAAANDAAAGGGATTIVVAVLCAGGPTGAGSACGRVGDSSAFVVPVGQPAFEVFEPPDPERSVAATQALPSETAQPEVRSIDLEAGAVLALVTDGIADPWRDGPTTVGPALSAALQARPEPLALLGLADFSRQGCHDDRTVLCVWLRGAKG